jgi:ABC-type multidrug transport system permease subunit
LSISGDEISTGLDTASTVDILRILSFSMRFFNRTAVVSLLQPSPEAVAMFDEIILLSEGHVIYAGPTKDAGGHFRNLGYRQPDSMDDADYLLAVASSDRNLLSTGDTHSTEMLASIHAESKQQSKILEKQQQDWETDWKATGDKDIPKRFLRKYQNPFQITVWLNLRRFFTLWTRDKTFIRASVIKNIAMGLSVGFVFLNTTLNSSYFGVLFQGNLFIMLGAMTSAPEKVDARAVYYKHADSNFYSALSYVIGEALAACPQMLIDVLLFGIFVYWMVGFVPTAASFIIYLLLFFLFTFAMGQTYGLLAAIAPTKTVVQAGGAVVLLLNVLFCGYIVSPNVIPIYWNWLYWINPLPWIYRALLLNEFDNRPEGEEVMKSYGFLLPNGETFGGEWIGYGFAFIIPYAFLCLVASAYCLHRFRMEPKQQATPVIAKEKDAVEDESPDTESSSFTDASFIPVDLSFRDLCYDVKASTGSDKLRLLNNVSGVFSSGRLCALMGESGAGKLFLCCLWYLLLWQPNQNSLITSCNLYQGKQL